MTLINYKKQVRDRLWELLEAEPEITSRLADRVKNKLKLNEEAGWVRAMMTNAGPADFPRINIPAGRWRHSAFTSGQTLATERQTFLTEGYEWEVERILRFRVQVTSGPRDVDAHAEFEEAVQLALLRGGPRLNLDYVVAWGPMDASDEQYTRKPEQSTDGGGPQAATPRLRTIIDFPILIKLSGRELTARS